MIKIQIVSLILLLILGSCKKENAVTTTNNAVYFSGITVTNNIGNLLASPDTSDWRFDDNWTSKEENLFSTKYTTSNQKTKASILIYPNPFQEFFIVNLDQMPTKSRLAVRLVNKDFKVILANDSIVGTSSLVPLNLNNNDTLRLYYKLIDSSKYEYKGHGDVLFKK